MYKENHKIPPKLLEVKNEFLKVAGYKINVQKSVACLPSNRHSLKEKLRK
jgi:hypothetical protein